MGMTKVKDAMHPNPHIIQPKDTVKEAAKHMKQKNCGVLPVGSADHIEGMITDRDITIRIIAEGKDPEKTHVEDVMTKKIHTCEEDDDLVKASEIMMKHEVGRLVVVNKSKKVTGILTQAGLLSQCKDHKVLEALAAARKKHSGSGSCH
jgi:predicted transcriptional regulator